MAIKYVMSRRVALGRVAGAATVVLGGGISPLLAQEKVTQANAKYQNHPNGQQRCDICQLFRPPSSCQIVAGTISPNGWCQFFTAKENAH
jgi:hypothetical protein